MNNWNPQKIIDLLVECSKIALHYYGNTEKELKSDRSIVTIADKNIEKLLSEHFDKPLSGSYLIGEETIFEKSEEYIKEALNSTTWVVDPIDGTAPYSNHLPHWGISIGYMQKGIIKEGAIFLPCTNELFITDNEKVYFKHIKNSKKDYNFESFNELSKPIKELNDSEIISLTQSFAKNFHIDIHNPIQVLSCATFSFTYTLLGRFIAYVGSSIKLWDYAAALIMLKLLDINVSFFDKTELSCDIRKNHNLIGNSQYKWNIKNRIITTANENIINYIINNSKNKKLTRSTINEESPNSDKIG
jgi:myo-inositol-1(or 4)-monophosphatase